MSGIIMGQVNGAVPGGGGGGGGGSGGQIQLTLTPDNAVGYTYGGGSGVTPSVTVSWTGGTAPFTVLWSYVSGSSDFTIAPNTAASTVSWSNSVGLNDTKYADWKVRVTDFYGNFEEAPCPVALIDISFEGGGGGIIIP